MDFYHQPTQPESEAKASVEEAVSVEIASSTVERRTNPMATGYVESNPFALFTCDTTWAVPDFLPLGSVAWPDPLLAIWKTMNYASLVGLLPEITRVWFTVDNKLGLWDYRGMREFCLYDEIPELIVAVGVPVRPRADVFQPHVTYVLPVATASTVFLLGLCVVNSEELSEIKIVNLGYSVKTSAIITKMVGVVESGRIFCAGGDGNVYELRYTREGSLLVPKIRLVCFSYIFSSHPIIGQIASVANMVKQTWTGRSPGIRDIVVDTRRELVLGLDENSTITAWMIVPDGLKLVKSLRHQPQAITRARGSDFSPLLRLFVIQPDPEGCTLVAVALSGDQFRYRYLNPLARDFYADLTLRTFIPSNLHANQEVSVCFAAETVMILAGYERESDDTSSDDIVAITAPCTIMDPHNNVRDIVTVQDATSSGIVRVDAIDVIPNATRRSPNDLSAQVCYPPTRFIVAHRHGLSLYMQMRPVDTLYVILSCSDPKSKESLLKRFANVFNATDYATMLLQVAVGALNVQDTRSVSPREAAPSAGGLGLASSSLGATLEQVSRRICEGDSIEARRTAQELLRNMTFPVTQASSAVTSNGYQVTVLMSPFSTGVVTYIGRALYGVWELPVSKLPREDFGPLKTVLSRLIQYMESISIGARSEPDTKVDVPHQWQRNRVVVSLPEGTHLSVHDVNRLQLSMLHSCYDLASKSLQTVTLLQQARFIPVQQEERTVTFSQLVRDQEVARRYANYISRVILSSQDGIWGAAGGRLKTFSELQKRCPYFFSTVDLQELQVHSEIDNLSRSGSLGSLSNARLSSWIASVAPNAGAYWASGMLQGICQQLSESKRHDAAAQLLLHAASQIDPNGDAVTLYFAERNGQSVQASATPALYGAYQSKSRALEALVRLLEGAWHTHRSAVDRLLGGPRTSGIVWTIEPNDEFAHCYLFDWLCFPREDAAINRTLRQTLVAARSQFLEKYLTRNAALLGAEYAQFLRHSQHNYKAAIEQSVLLADSTLSDVPEADRLTYRIRCLTEALECARECGSDQIQQVEQRLRWMQAQQKVGAIIADFLASGLAREDTHWTVDGQRVSERALALQHMDLVANRVCTTTNLLQIAGMYPTLGGAEVQLDVLVSSNVHDTATYATCITRAYSCRGSTVEETTRRLIERYYRPAVSFPISFVIRMVEARQHSVSPRGSTKSVQLLLDCNVDVKVIFHAYQEIIESQDEVEVVCEPFVQAQVTAGYLIHSLAVVLTHMASAARRGSVQLVIASNAVAVTHTYHAQAAKAYSGNQDEREALSASETLIFRADAILRSGGYAY